MRIVIIEDDAANVDSALEAVRARHGQLPVFALEPYQEQCPMEARKSKSHEGELLEDFVLVARDHRGAQGIARDIERDKEKGQTSSVDLVLIDLYLPINDVERDGTRFRPVGIKLAFRFSPLICDSGRILVVTKHDENQPHHSVVVMPPNGIYSINGTRCRFQDDFPPEEKWDDWRARPKDWGRYLDF